MREQADEEAGAVSRRGGAAAVAGSTCSRPTSDLPARFQLANRAFDVAPSVRHTRWRPFQLGFVLANLASIVDESADGERHVVDTLWFATGGGKTETYLLYVLTAAFYDRLRGKTRGHHVLGTLPAAHALAPADPALRRRARRGRTRAPRREHRRARVLARLPRREQRHAQPDPDAARPRRRARPRTTPTCRRATRSCCAVPSARRARSPDALRPDSGGPSTTSARHAAARGAAVRSRSGSSTRRSTARSRPSSSAPWTRRRASRCRPRCAASTDRRPGRARHRATASPTRRGAGRRVAACSRGAPRTPVRLARTPPCIAPTVRMQDELHLLRDSLGAVDSHYEALLDGLQAHYGSYPKIIASSATLAGHDEQVARPLPQGGPHVPAVPARGPDARFWSRDTDDLARRFAGLAPRGVTLEYATDQLTESLQRVTRRAVDDPAAVAAEIGVDPRSMPAARLDLRRRRRLRLDPQGRRGGRPILRHPDPARPAGQRRDAHRPHAARRGADDARAADPPRARLLRPHPSRGRLVDAVPRRRHRPAQRHGDARPAARHRRVHPDDVPRRPHPSRPRHRPAQDRPRARRRRLPDVPVLRRARRSSDRSRSRSPRRAAASWS